MNYIEVLIVAFVSLIGVLVSGYIIYNSYTDYKRARREIKRNDYSLEQRKRDKKILTISSITVPLVTILLVLVMVPKFIFLANKGILDKGEYYLFEIRNSEMAQENEENTYLDDNNLNAGLYKGDADRFLKVSNISSLKQYDIILFETENGYDATRITQVNSANFTTRKDSLTNDVIVSFSSIKGLYQKRETFISTLNYLDSSPSIYIITALLLITYGYYLFSAISKKKLEKLYDHKEEKKEN